MSARALAPDGGRLLRVSPPCTPSSRPRAAPARAAAAENPVASAALSATSRLRDSLLAASRDAERPAGARPPPVSAAAREATEWQAWLQTFKEADAQERLREALQAQLDSAVSQEDYANASLLADALRALQDVDAVGGMMRDLSAAIADQRFGDAAALRDAGAGLVGWWHGVDEPAGDNAVGNPRGCILHVTPSHGRFLGRVHTAERLADLHSRASSARGAALNIDVQRTPPSLEVFARLVSTTAPARYDTRAVVACPAYGGPAFGLGASNVAALNASESRAVNLDSAAQLVLVPQQFGTESSFDSDIGSDAALFTAFSAVTAAPSAPSPQDACEPAVDFRQLPPAPLQRVPASLLRLGLHQFLLHYMPAPAAPSGDGRGTVFEPHKRDTDYVALAHDQTAHDAAAANWGRAAYEVSTLDPSGPQHRAFLTPPVTAAKQTLHSHDLAVVGASHLRASRGSRVKATSGPHHAALPPAPVAHMMRFTRIGPRVASGAGADPLSALYLGAFGAHGPEVLQLFRGRWGDGEAGDEECVTAVKLTGDRNVPAGFASFRARVGRAHRLEHHGVYPDELGVLACYKGEGRAAKSAGGLLTWVDGELLLLDGKGGTLTGGAELGLVWAAPGERRFLILLSRLKLTA